MRPWIQVDSGIKEHDKIYNLADQLNIPNAFAVGLMTCLWAWASTACPNDGDITNFPPRAIATAAGWDKKNMKDVKKFYDALLSTKLLEQSNDGKILIRNWDLHQNYLVDYVEKQKEDNRRRVKKCRDQKKQGNITSESFVTLQNNTRNVTKTESNDFTPPIPVPNQDKLSVNNTPSSSTEETSKMEGGAGQDFGTVCQEFEKRVNPMPSAKDGTTLQELFGKYSVDRILTAINETARCKGRSASYVRSVLKNEDQGTTSPHAGPDLSDPNRYKNFGRDSDG